VLIYLQKLGQTFTNKIVSKLSIDQFNALHHASYWYGRQAKPSKQSTLCLLYPSLGFFDTLIHLLRGATMWSERKHALLEHGKLYALVQFGKLLLPAAALWSKLKLSCWWHSQECAALKDDCPTKLPENSRHTEYPWEFFWRSLWEYHGMHQIF